VPLGGKLLDSRRTKRPIDPVEFGADMDKIASAREIVEVTEPNGPAIVCLILLLHIRFPRRCPTRGYLCPARLQTFEGRARREATDGPFANVA
jgi:hypothetical protein